MSLPVPLRRCATRLRAMAPTKHPVRIRLVDGVLLRGAWGDCSLMGRGSGRYFLIRLDRGACLREPRLMAIVLCHEYAHALSWGKDAEEPHGSAFGEAVALIERIEAVRA